MKTLTDLTEEQKRNAEEAHRIAKEIDAKLKKTLVRCEPAWGCGMGYEIQELTYIQTKWYTPPSGCMGGDYWNNGEGQWKCPNCGKINRLYNKPEIMKLKHLFGKTEDAYARY